MSVTVQSFRNLALSLPCVTEAPHFELASFRVGGKIFSTLSETMKRAMVILTPDQQEMLTAAEPDIFQRIPNKWGDKGCTWLYLDKTDKTTAESALRLAFQNISSKSAKKSNAKPRSKAKAARHRV